MNRNKKNNIALCATSMMACFLAGPLNSNALAQAGSSGDDASIDPFVSGPGGHRMDVLLDLSGSMAGEACQKGGKPVTRLEVAKQVALGWLNRQPADNQDYLDSISSADPAVPSQVAVWTFQSKPDGDYLTKIVDYTDLATGVAEIQAIDKQDLAGSTPLAGSICRVLDSITGVTVRDILLSGGRVDPSFFGHRFFVATDGEENSTPSTNECDGETSQLTMDDRQPGEFFPDFEPSTWQYKVSQKFLRFGDSAGVLIQDAEIPTPVVDAVYLLPNVFYGHGCSDVKQALNKNPSRKFPTANFLRNVSEFSQGAIQVVVPDLVTGEIDLSSLVQFHGPSIDEILDQTGALQPSFVTSLAESPFAQQEGISGVFDDFLNKTPVDGDVVGGLGNEIGLGHVDAVGPVGPIDPVNPVDHWFGVGQVGSGGLIDLGNLFGHGILQNHGALLNPRPTTHQAFPPGTSIVPSWGHGIFVQ